MPRTKTIMMLAGLVAVLVVAAMGFQQVCPGPPEPLPDPAGECLGEPGPQLWRIQAKEDIARRLTRGTLGLPDAVREVRELYRDDPAFLDSIRSSSPRQPTFHLYPGAADATDDELFASNLILFVKSQAEVLPAGQAAEVVRRLEAEFERCHSAGTFRYEKTPN
ncbi:hypothetical protein [Limnoglobus roseus]|uniref:Uncharacterized protein n=1 Tax=Limnoglobus roseus TaxID=2598579 RepID=A0A5C1AMI5_9BACT|nr:hypothetical protein [Limnoglobus roseus]QEL20190.1 hypothetical protein PX52LOC_07278 [Limnoglobus roseus]